MVLRIGWFTTARGSGSKGMYEAVVSAIDNGLLDAEVAFVFCNRERGESSITDEFLDAVQARGTPVERLSSVKFRKSVGGGRSQAGQPLPEWRVEYDTEVDRLLAKYRFDVGVLAGYMLIFTEQFVVKHSLLNLHPALPTGPYGTWREVILDLIRERRRKSGVMVHIAAPEVDRGPVLSWIEYDLHESRLRRLWKALEPKIDSLTDDELEQTELFGAIRELQVTWERPFLVATLIRLSDRQLKLPPANCPREITGFVRELHERPPVESRSLLPV